MTAVVIYTVYLARVQSSTRELQLLQYFKINIYIHTRLIEHKLQYAIQCNIINNNAELLTRISPTMAKACELPRRLLILEAILCEVHQMCLYFPVDLQAEQKNMPIKWLTLKFQFQTQSSHC